MLWAALSAISREIDPQVLNRNFQVNTMALLHLGRRLGPAMVEGWCGFNLMPEEAAAKISTSRIC
jgi:hypothetical protein